MAGRFFLFSLFDDEIQDFAANFWLGFNQSLDETSRVSPELW
jgi:hypothetical protein